MVSRSQHGVTAVRITEVEAYEGPDDPASHAFRGPNRRNQAEFGAPGTFYVYRTHAVHRCPNTVCGPGRRPASVLLRAGTVVKGTDVAQERRGPRVRGARPGQPRPGVGHLRSDPSGPPGHRRRSKPPGTARPRSLGLSLRRDARDAHTIRTAHITRTGRTGLDAL
ncbi:DNA-3-methyladenine glycosylase [Streptomyces sp. NPDC059629]|uniref:DNA-3-methyladenine glycosylase n=1 Tax=Streptomyces sp. NPDC059629 TaxID=3346889 RepID=UPI00368F2D6C